MKIVNVFSSYDTLGKCTSLHDFFLTEDWFLSGQFIDKREDDHRPLIGSSFTHKTEGGNQ